ncbi:MAG: class I SAM-dependent methyltransferase [Actinomycetota bacterium]|nr:class I SAM-dependent methyltransferase [Actinomycetota bacterium]
MDLPPGDGDRHRAVTTVEEASARLGALVDSLWALAAAGLALRFGLADGERPIAPDDPVVDVLVELGLVVTDDGTTDVAPGLKQLLTTTGAVAQADEMVASVRQVLRLLTEGPGALGWAGEDDESLVAQGRASMGLVNPLVEFVFPQLDGLDERLRRPGGRFLDIGVGIGGLATAMCDEFPALSVVGLDVLPRALDLARAHVAERGLGDRIELRHLDVAGIEDADAYDLVWLPLPFVSPASLRVALPRLQRALRPGGWLLASMGRLEGDSLSVALTLWRTSLLGGTVLPPERLAGGLVEAGFTDVTALETPPSAPVVVVARRPKPR